MPLADFLIGRTIANYRIERLLGRGGMASVYYGYDSQLQRPAAIKVIDERHSGETSYSERFIREARAMASWRHPNIPQIYQAGVENGIYFYAMEYIHGMDLEDLLRQSVLKGELLAFEDVLSYGKAIAEALDYAHLRGAIHRDVKPSNVLISTDGRILLTDFGLILEVEKGTQGEVFGSPLYIAPEQARSSADAVPQSDLYSLGVILYEMVVGRLPFEDVSSASLAIKHLFVEPPAPRQLNPDLSSEAEAVLLKALSKKPQERYQTGKGLMAALEEGIGGPLSGIRTKPLFATSPATLPFLPIDPQFQPPSWDQEPETGRDRAAGTDWQLPSALSDRPEVEIPGVDRQAEMPRSRNRTVLVALIAIGALVILCVFLPGAIWLFGQLGKSALGSAAGLPSPAFLAVQGQSTPTPIKPAQTIAVEPSPTINENVGRLSLSVQKPDSFLMINQGNTGIPLAQLRLGAQKGGLSGVEWGVDILLPGECVTVSKKEGHSAPPAGAQCKLVGKVLTRSAPNKFWDSVVDVYFKDVLVATCDLGETGCEFNFDIPAP